MTSSRSSGASPAMPEQGAGAAAGDGRLPMSPRGRLDRRRTSRIAPSWISFAALLAFAVAAPVAVLAGSGSAGAEARGGTGIEALAPPAETCRPEETRAAGAFSDICGSNSGGGGGGFNVGSLLPILGLVAVGGAVLLIAAFVVLRRTSAPLVPADPGEWWTCRNCGKNNVRGSARCYACGAWQR